MASTQSFRKHISARAATGVIALTGCVLSAVVLANRTDAAAAQEARRHFDRTHEVHHHHHFGKIQWGWDVLPVVPLAASLMWNLFSGLVLASGTYFWLPRRMHLSLDALVAVSSVVLPWISLIWNVTSVHHRDNKHRPQPPMPSTIKHLMIAGVIMATVVAIMHVTFFCYGCKKTLVQQQDEKTEVAPPVYATENPFDDAKSSRSLPIYEKRSFEITEEKKEAEVEVVEVEQEFV